jgi:hypothetical protein
MKKSNLLGALQTAAATPEPVRTVKAETAERAGQGSASREGKESLTVWLDPQFRQNLMMLKTRRVGDMQGLVADALNALFEQHGLPVVRK